MKTKTNVTKYELSEAGGELKAGALRGAGEEEGCVAQNATIVTARVAVAVAATAAA